MRERMALVIEERIADRCREAEAGRPAASFGSRQPACAAAEIDASPWNRDADHQDCWTPPASGGSCLGAPADAKGRPRRASRCESRRLAGSIRDPPGGRSRRTPVD
jgi:hypothetical protein